MFEVAKDVFAVVGVAVVLIGVGVGVAALLINRLGEDGQIP